MYAFINVPQCASGPSVLSCILFVAARLQPGLNFGERKKELFASKEMGEDALRVLDLYVTARDRVLADIAGELPTVRAAVAWAAVLNAR